MNFYIVLFTMFSREDAMQAIQQPDAVFIPWASRNGLCSDIGQARICALCGSNMLLHYTGRSEADGAVFRCVNSRCSTTLSIRYDWWTSVMKLSLRKIAHLLICWIEARPVQFTIADTGVSRPTVIRYFDFFRMLAGRAYRKDLVENPLGSTGGTVQIDESLFNRAKYNRGSALARPKMWFFAAVDCETNRLAVELCEDRSKATLQAMIEGMVAPGATIWSDSWRGYAGLEDAGFDHGVVNHRLNYRDPETGVHTNRIEGNWGALKQFLRRQRATHRNWTEAYVHEYCFRRNIVDSFYTCWRRIIEAQLETRG